MLQLILTLSIFNLIRNAIFINNFKNIYYYFFIEMVTLSFSNKIDWFIYVKWFYLGFTNTIDDKEYIYTISNINNNTTDIYNYIPIISYSGSFISYILLVYLIKRDLDYVYKYGIKFLIWNYLLYSLLSIHEIYNLNGNFWYNFINVLIYNFTVFGIPSCVCYFIYGEELSYYRSEYDFLIKNLKLPTKYFLIILLFVKSILSLYPLVNNIFYIFSVNIFYFLVLIYFKPFKKSKYLYIVGSLSSINIILNIIDTYLETYELYILNLIIYFILIFFIINNNFIN
jgi:hypothetical protein